jgi:cobalt/nickel transport system permease protein
MEPLRPAHGDSIIHRVDPRARILLTVAFVLLIVAARRFEVLGAALAVAVAGVFVARLPLGRVLGRLVPLNLLMLMLALVLPLTASGAPWFHLGPLPVAGDGLLLAAKIALKGNAILLVLMALLGTLEITVLGHALSHLWVPDKLNHLFLFTVRYIAVFQREYRRLAAAMKIRGFRPRMSRHTYRTYGYLVGMLLVRSFDRSERIAAAMKCRGFRGRFYLLDHFGFSRHDLPFCIASSAVLLVLILLEVLLLVP